MRYFLITILAVFTLRSIAQTSASFIHLGNSTFQNNFLNPSLIPEGDLFIGLPALSGVHVHANSKVSYNEAFTIENNTTLVNIDKILPNLQRQNLLSAHVNVNLFHVGIKTKNGSLISFSANERVEGDGLYSRELVDYVWNANDQFLNQEVNVAKAGLKLSHFREFGIGFATSVNEQLTVGLRGKFLIGFIDASLPHNFRGTVTSSGEIFQFDAEWENFALRTSGRDIFTRDEGNLGSHLIMNSNTGAALDIGGTYRLNRYYTITGSLLDIGFINWNEDISSDILNDTTFFYGGVDLRDVGSVRNVLEDSLIAAFETTNNFDPYRSWLPLKAYGSWIYHYNRKTDIYITVGSRMIQRQLKTMYAGGVTHRFGKVFTGSLTATKLPQQFFNMGASFAVKGGPVQLYMAADQILNFSIPDMRSFDFRFGINLIFGKRGEKTESAFGSRPPIQSAKGLDTNVFLGKRVKTKKRDGIYSIIKRQRRRELKNKRSTRDNKVKKESLTGRKGRKNTYEE